MMFPFTFYDAFEVTECKMCYVSIYFLAVMLNPFGANWL